MVNFPAGSSIRRATDRAVRRFGKSRQPLGAEVLGYDVCCYPSYVAEPNCLLDEVISLGLTEFGCY